MEAAVALGLAILSVPFILPLISWLIARKTRQRVEDLEARLAMQDERIDQLSLQLKKLSASAPSTFEELLRDRPAATAPAGTPAVKVSEPIVEPKPIVQPKPVFEPEPFVPPPVVVAPPPLPTRE